MNLTKEQTDIINASGNIKINAVAGSGKTTTIIEYAKACPKKSKILYLAFNKSVKLEAINKFTEKGMHNVKVETAHSLAFRHIIPKYGYKIKSNGYKTHEITELLGLKSTGEKHAEYILANHINKFITYFCNSEKSRVQELNYLDIITDSKAKKYVRTFYKLIEKQTRILLSKMNNGDIEITHDFYLKKFQLAQPSLPYDYILFDEGQDASPAMLDIFMKQHATKVIVGDTHQQIYGWRHAVNSLEKADFKNLNLTTSFRFNQDIANLAMEILKWKGYLGSYNPISITGKGVAQPAEDTQKLIKAILARTNLGLLLKAIEYVTEKATVKHIYFEGNIHSYTYADDGTSLYDVLNLYNGKRRLIKDKLIKAMYNLSELEEYIEKTEDVQLGMMVEIVKEYGNEIPGIIKTIKDKHIDGDDKDKAEMIFSTIHRCKGMEYDTIELVNDFITEEKLEKVTKDKKQEFSPSKLNEEINLLYVAITRTHSLLHIPETLIPVDFPPSPQIHMIHTKKEEDEKGQATTPNHPSGSKKPTRQNADKAYTYEKVRKEHTAAYKPWTPDQDDELTVMFCEGVKLQELAKYFGRTKGAILSRIKKLELNELYGA